MNNSSSQLPYFEKRPWGSFTKFSDNEKVTVKIITVEPNQAFSLQTHAHRDEFWKILSGNGFVTLDDNSLPIEIGSEFNIPRGTKHRLTAGSAPVSFLEIARGDFDENDIERIEDNYGRVTAK